MTLSRRSFALSVSALAGLALAAPRAACATVTLSPDQARAIAHEAYVYGFPMIDAYRIQWAYFVDAGGPQYKGPVNVVHSAANVFTPADTAVQTPNSDTPYSFAWIDLRAEPLVLTLPEVEKDRYHSVQLIDTYTYNFDYLGTRTTGNGAGRFLLAGPGWTGTPPEGIDKLVRAETDFALAIIRTQLFGPDDLDAVRKIQAGYTLQPLSAFAGTPAPPAAAPITFPKPLAPDDERTSPEGLGLLAFLLQFAPVLPDETALRARFAQIGVAPGQSFDPATLTPDLLAAVKAGIADGQKAIDARRATTTTSVDLFGTRAYLKNDYVNRALGAQKGIFGNSKDEAYYGLYEKLPDGQPLVGTNRYTLRFPKGQLPPVKAFWSITMYDLPGQLLVANPINRYLINSTMLKDLTLDADGGLTIHIQSDPPETALAANWLPAPKGPFMVVSRLYLPDASVLDGRWTAPDLALAPA